MPTRTVSVICAYPFLGNSGMFSVDLAFQHSLFPVLSDVNTTYYSLEGRRSDITTAAGLTFRYENLIERFDEAISSDAIVFWGDFQHAHSYLYRDLRQRGIDVNVSLKHLFLGGCDEAVLRKVMVFGESLIVDNINTQQDVAFSRASERFFRGVDHIYMRDVFSAMKVAGITKDFHRNFLGADCALLLDFDSLLGDTPPAPPVQQSMGVFFARTELNASHLLDFAMETAQATDTQAEWASWFALPPQKEQRVRERFPDLAFGTPPQTIFDIYRKLRSFSFVITDTYHLALTSWRLGVPAICIGRGAKMSQTTLDDKKKETLYAMYDAEPFYLFAEYFADPAWRTKATQYVRTVIQNDILTKAVIERMAQHATAAADKARSSLKQLLEKS